MDGCGKGIKEIGSITWVKDWAMEGNNGVRPRDEASNLNKIKGHSGRCVLRGDLTRYDLDVTLLAVFYQSDASTREETEVKLPSLMFLCFSYKV